MNPDIEIVAEYITDAPDFDGFNQPDRAQVIATTMYEDGADIIYHAAGGAGNGMFQAAKDFTDDNGSKVWGIGVDDDQYQTIGTVDPSLQEFILTSMLKRVDVAVFEVLKAQEEGCSQLDRPCTTCQLTGSDMRRRVATSTTSSTNLRPRKRE